MWSGVRAAKNTLTWAVGEQPQPGVLEGWGATMRVILDARRAFGPIDPQSPYALLASATTGALRAAGTPPVVDPAGDPFADVRARLREVVPQLGASTNPAWGSRLLARTSYELVHLTQTQVAEPEARRWLQAGERAFEVALFHPAPPSDTYAALANWQRALAGVPPHSDLPALQRAMLRGHVAVLRQTGRLLGLAEEQSAVTPREILGDLQRHIQTLATRHGERLSDLERQPAREATAAEEQAMLGLGRAVRQLRQLFSTRSEPLQDQLTALLRSGVGASLVVAQLTGHTAADRAAGERLDATTVRYLADHIELGPLTEPQPAPRVRPTAPEPDLRATPVPRLERGIKLDPDTVLRLVRDRDLGMAARNADPDNPPAELAEIPPQNWPALAAAGDQAIADLVTSVAPLAFKVTQGQQPSEGGLWEDFDSEVMLDLVKAAHAYQPDSGASWSHFAYVRISADRYRSVDAAGVRETARTIDEDGRKVPWRPKPTVPLEDAWMQSRTLPPAPNPEDIVVGQADDKARSQAVRDAIDSLEPRQRTAVTLHTQGMSGRGIGREMGVSESTGHRDLRAGLAQLRDRLAPEILNTAERPNPADPLGRAQQTAQRTPPPSTPRHTPRR